MFLLIVLFALPLGIIQGVSPVATKNGLVRGTTEEVNGRTILKYIGIPFAHPPINERRFKLPDPVRNWGLLDATKRKPHCMQPPDIFMDHIPKDKKNPFLDEYDKVQRSVTYSEDCLYLDIYTPYRSKNKPVMLWIYGGGFVLGGAGFYDASELASRGDVIVVVIQYRLGIFGFLKGNDRNAPGNVGLWDQVEAMKWVHKNIAAFGGDPNQVTIFGESAGGMSVGFHLITDHASTYFKNAIMQSGSSLSFFLAVDESHSVKTFEEFVKATKCPTGHDGKATAQTYDCIQKMTTDAIWKIVQTNLERKFGAFDPTIDVGSLNVGCFFCRKVYDFKDNHLKVLNKNILMGTNSDEGVIVVALPEILPPFEGKPKDLTFDALKKSVPAERKDLQYILDDQFFKDIDKKDPVQVRDRFIQLGGDIIFTCPDKMFIEHVIKDLKDKFSKSIHYYRLDYQISMMIGNKEWVKGALHGDDIPFLFGYPLKYPEIYSKIDQSVSKNMIEIWTNFAKSKSPSPIGVTYENFGPIAKDNWNHLLIDKDGSFKGVKGFPKNLCNLLPIDIYQKISGLIH